MAKTQFWITRLRPGGIEVPVATAAVARVFDDAGWEVLPLPRHRLSDRNAWYLERLIDPRR